MTSQTMTVAEALAVMAAVRPPDRNRGLRGLPSAIERTLEWDADLTGSELQAVADVRAVARSAAPMSASQFAAIRGQVQTLRDLRQMGRAGFMALNATERDRLLYDAQAATTTILLALLRD